jgi:hypothetical protein
MEERHHAFQNINKKLDDLKNLSYPVYDINREHKFNEIQKNLTELKCLRGPVYDVNHINQFNEEMIKRFLQQSIVYIF